MPTGLSGSGGSPSSSGPGIDHDQERDTAAQCPIEAVQDDSASGDPAAFPVGIQKRDEHDQRDSREPQPAIDPGGDERAGQRSRLLDEPLLARTCSTRPMRPPTRIADRRGRSSRAGSPGPCVATSAPTVPKHDHRDGERDRRRRRPSLPVRVPGRHARSTAAATSDEHRAPRAPTRATVVHGRLTTGAPAATTRRAPAASSR